MAPVLLGLLQRLSGRCRWGGGAICDFRSGTGRQDPGPSRAARSLTSVGTLGTPCVITQRAMLACLAEGFREPPGSGGFSSGGGLAARSRSPPSGPAGPRRHVGGHEEFAEATTPGPEGVACATSVCCCAPAHGEANSQIGGPHCATSRAGGSPDLVSLGALSVLLKGIRPVDPAAVMS